MKTRGFTLLELVVVIIILGILATLGIGQYGRMIERARGAEARTVLGQIRSAAASFRLENGAITGFGLAQAGIDNTNPVDPTRIPGEAVCANQTSNYFGYTVNAVAEPSITIRATRCVGGGGKNPTGTAALTLTLTSNLATGVDAWGGTGGY